MQALKPVASTMMSNSYAFSVVRTRVSVISTGGSRFFDVDGMHVIAVEGFEIAMIERRRLGEQGIIVKAGVRRSASAGSLTAARYRHDLEDPDRIIYVNATIAAHDGLRMEAGGYRPDQLRAFAQRVEVADDEVRIMGSRSELRPSLVTASRVDMAASAVL